MTLDTARLSALVFNHLWQSTLFAAAAALLTLALRRNSAHTRFWLWWLASVKFLVPFWLLMAAGAALHPQSTLNAQVPAFAFTVDGLAQPFPADRVTLPLKAAAPSHTVPLLHTAHGTLPWMVIGTAVWLTGVLLLLTRWFRRWIQLRTAVRASTPVLSIQGIPVYRSPAQIEPGIFGIVRPLLLLPEGLDERLSTPQMEAIFAHELCHVLRHDNLLAAVHMLTETLFWFHPLVWYLGARLIDERERACDEAVLAGSALAETYAESILTVCKFYTEVRLPCISGITGSDLKQRIVRIMNCEAAARLSMPRKAMLGTAAVLALGLPVGFGILHARVVHAQEAAKPNKGVEGTSEGLPHAVSPAHETSPSDTAPAVDLSGDWQVLFSGAPGGTRIVFRLSKSRAVWHAVAYWVGQNSYPTVIPAVTLRGDAVSFTTTELNGSFEGELSTDRATILGHWTQGKDPKIGLPTQLVTMVRATKATAWELPAPLISAEQIMAASLDPTFEVTTVKPHDPNQPGGGWRWIGARRFQATMPVSDLIANIYGLNRQQILGAPDWANKDLYDYAGVPDLPGLPTQQQRYSMERKLLEERFQLKVHLEKREMSGLALTQANSGARIASSVLVDPGCTLSFHPAAAGGLVFDARNSSMSDFKRMLQQMLDRPVVDQTGLTGQFDFDLTFMPDDTIFAGHMQLPPVDSPNPPPALLTAMQEQLGLKLSAYKGLGEMLVIDHIERPSPN